MLRIGVIGLGYWGPKLAEAFSRLDGARLAAVCDLDQARLARTRAQFPGVFAAREAERLFGRTLDAVVISTPARSHYALARQALELGMHVFVEKPLATTPRECEALIRLAALRSRTLLVGHTFLHTAAVDKVTELVRAGELGHICYIHSSRLNLGPVRSDVSVLWDLATHDVSIMLQLMGRLPVRVHCQGLAYLNEQIHDVCSLTLDFAGKSMGFVQVSWLHPDKRRRLTVVGDRQMAVYDDVDAAEKVKVYDRGVVADARADCRYTYRNGDARIPALVEVEPLLRECRHFLDCVTSGATPITDGRNGLDVVRVLHAAEASLRAGGTAQPLEPVGDLLQTPVDRDIAARIPLGSDTRGGNGRSAR
jgi:predicted dehydrogenase